MAIIVTVPAHHAPSPVYCPLTCDHDQCMKYNNEAMKFFCRCHSGWSGVHCHIPIRCDDCSSDSICLVSINNRSIYLCPLNKVDPRCLLTDLCPRNFCKTHDHCIVIDEPTDKNRYVCICSEQFYGP
ncbi:unnamed protein product [Rotaria sp. Silwood1]|nr:unnamed protein product [Rotaria sp. Silwood1]CAF4591936.1 unnamed protein product [Rotaria sp. Silwood1]CAF4853517.1 unnamed protein product [Rotaria sp. Silwood1]